MAVPNDHDKTTTKLMVFLLHWQNQVYNVFRHHLEKVILWSKQ